MAPDIHGTCHPDWTPVRDAFAANMGRELGAAIAVYADGQQVVDLWAGDAADGRPWRPDTLCTAFSSTKGLVALCLNQLVERGRLDLDATVASYWPEFSQAGKGGITVRTLLEHRAGLSWIDDAFDLEVLGDLPRLADRIAAQPPGLPVGTQGYGSTAWGMYAGVLFWKITGESVGTWLSREVAAPLAADAHLGLDPAEGPRLASLVEPGLPDLFGTILPRMLVDTSFDGRVYRAAVNKRSPLARSVAHPPRLGRGFIPRLAEPDVLRTELPWVGAAVSARGLGRIYGALANGGVLDGVRLLDADTVAELDAPAELRRDAVLCKDVAWRRGFIKEEPGMFSPDGTGFGHPGAGGSLGWAMPGHRVGIGYVMNRMSPRLRSPRARRLCRAVWQVLGI